MLGAEEVEMTDLPAMMATVASGRPVTCNPLSLLLETPRPSTFQSDYHAAYAYRLGPFGGLAASGRRPGRHDGPPSHTSST